MTRRLLLVGCIVLFAATNVFGGTTLRKLKLIKAPKTSGLLSSTKTQYYLKGQYIDQSYQVDTTKNMGGPTATVLETAMGELTLAPGDYDVTLDTDYIPITGTLNTYSLDFSKGYGKYKVTKCKVIASVVNAAKPELKPKYKVDVGIAKKFGKKGAFTVKDTVLTGIIKSQKGVISGTTFRNVTLASKLAPKGTLNMETGVITHKVDAKGKTKEIKRLYKAVGSEAEIVAADVAADGSTVAMEWRQRTKGEAHDPKALKTGVLPDPSLAPTGGQWLTSDVVKISGLQVNVAYALRMTFDNRINMALDGPVDGTVANELDGLFIATRDGTDTGDWQKVAATGAHAQGWVTNRTLEEFLADNSAYTLADLVGSWGVEKDEFGNFNDQGTNHSWVIVSGTGSDALFAVVPEPSTLILIGVSAGIGVMAYGLRRRKNKVS